MRVGIISFDFDPPIGGQGIYVKNLVGYLEKKNIDYLIFSSSPSTSPKNIKLPRFSKNNFGPIIFSIFVNLLISSWIKKYQLDLIHLQGGAGGTFLLHKTPKPLITTSHMLYSIKHQQKPTLKYRLLKLLESTTFHHSHTIIATSNLMKKEITHSYQINPNKITTIYPGIDTTLFSPTTSSQKNHNLLFVGRISPNKRILELTQIIILLKKHIPHLTLTIIGQGELTPQLLNLISTRHAHHYIKYLGPKNETELPQFYQQAALTILPSTYEPFGIATAESLACGTPVIVPNNSGLAEIINPAKCWNSFDSTLNDLKKTIQLFLQHRPNLTRQSRQTAITHFDQTKTNQKILNTYAKYA